jgi:hypothetical protein
LRLGRIGTSRLQYDWLIRILGRWPDQIAAALMATILGSG